jgi:hypothetical protein
MSAQLVWNNARRAVGMPPATMSTAWRSEYFHIDHVETTICADGSLVYKDVWKDANNFFPIQPRAPLRSEHSRLSTEEY